MKVSGYLHAPAALPPEKNPDTHRTEDWVRPRAGLDVFGKEKIILSLAGFEPRTVQSVM